MNTVSPPPIITNINQSKGQLSRQRHTGLDWLRVLSAFGVVINHAWYLMPGSPVIERCAAAFIYSLVFPAVPLFVLLSGAFILTHDKTINAWEFYKHSLRKLFPISCFFFAIYLVCKTDILHRFLTGENSLYETLDAIVRWYGRGAATPLWYLCMLPGLYLLAPFFSFIRKKMSLFFFGVLSLFLLSFTLLAQGAHWNFFHPLSAIVWLGLFCMGAWLMMLEKKYHLPSKRICFVFWLLFIAIETIDYARTGSQAHFHEILGRDSWAFNAACSISLFTLFCQWHPKNSRIVARLSELSLLIYLMHVLVQAGIRRFLCLVGGIDLVAQRSVWDNLFFALGSLILTCLAAWVASWAWKKMRASGAILRGKVLKQGRRIRSMTKG